MSKTQFFPVIIVKLFLTNKGFFENAEIMLFQSQFEASEMFF